MGVHMSNVRLTGYECNTTNYIILGPRPHPKMIITTRRTKV